MIYSVSRSHGCGISFFSSVSRIFFLGMLCSPGLGFTDYFSLCLLWKFFISPSVLKDIFNTVTFVGSYFILEFEIPQPMISWSLMFLLIDLLVF